MWRVPKGAMNYLLWSRLLLFTWNTSSCDAEFDTPVDLGSDMPYLATAFVQTGNELQYLSDVEYHENLVSGAPVKRYPILTFLLFMLEDGPTSFAARNGRTNCSEFKN